MCLQTDPPASDPTCLPIHPPTLPTTSFPTMISEMMEIIVKVLTKERERTREVVEAILDSEQEYLFTNDREYKDNRSEIVANKGGSQGGQ